MSKKLKQLDDLAQTRRYSRQIMLPVMDLAGQERLLNSKVLVVGLGGLGCAATPYLASAGVGQLTLVDGDCIDLSNLQRQILFTEIDIGRNKAEIAARQLLAQNPTIQIKAISQFADAELLAKLIGHHDLVLDCTDNLKVRRLINQACVRSKTVLVSGAAVRFEGQICCFTNQGNGPCYNCLSMLFGEPQLSCLEAGIFAPVVGVIGISQALLALNILAGVGQIPWYKLQLFDGLSFDWRQFTLPRSDDCPVCRVD